MTENEQNPSVCPTSQTSAALALVLEAGQTLLENGSEVFRAQQTMEIMAKSLGLADFHAYVLTNGIFTSVGEQRAGEVRHIPHTAIHLGRVEAVNELSRELAGGDLTLAAAQARMAQIHAMPGISLPLGILAAALGSGCFALLFGGTAIDVPVAALAGGAEVLLTRLLRRARINRIFSDIVAAALCTAIALACAAVFPAVHAGSSIIGALMVLTPGVALVMGIRDFLSADYLSGTIRLINALLIAGSLAFGVGVTYTAARLIWGVLL